MTGCKKCSVCGVIPVPEKLSMNERYVASCKCGITCLGSTPAEAESCWNHIQESGNGKEGSQ